MGSCIGEIRRCLSLMRYSVSVPFGRGPRYLYLCTPGNCDHNPSVAPNTHRDSAPCGTELPYAFLRALISEAVFTQIPHQGTISHRDTVYIRQVRTGGLAPYFYRRVIELNMLPLLMLLHTLPRLSRYELICCSTSTFNIAPSW